jgi:hypothetical protein
MKAPHDGQYLLNGVPFRMFEGDPLPDGAEVVTNEPEPEAKADVEPENKADKAPAKKKD